MIMSGSIAVLGCGWLGLDLARSFVADGHIVRGSCQSQASVQKLSSFGVKGHNIQLEEKSISGNISSFLQGSSRLFLTLPPGLRSDPKRNFVAVMVNVAWSCASWWIFISGRSCLLLTEVKSQWWVFNFFS